jgi:hypothetical protein
MQMRLYERVRIVRPLRPPEHYGGRRHDLRPPVVEDTGYLIEFVQKPGLLDRYWVESSSAATGGRNIWQCVFSAEELEPVDQDAC